MTRNIERFLMRYWSKVYKRYLSGAEVDGVIDRTLDHKAALVLSEQCTGRRDSTDSLIWEHSIVECDGDTGYVVWSDEEARFQIAWGVSGIIGSEEGLVNSNGTSDLTVIGNIHENLELLEGK